MPAEITLYNRQRRLRLEPKTLHWLQQLAARALLHALRQPTREEAPLKALSEIEVTFLSDAAIARVHRDFMAIPGATDVITFDHGEILISVETALENARLYHRTWEAELALYVIHGLLHLGGYEDKEPHAAATMYATQEKILAVCLEELGEIGCEIP